LIGLLETDFDRQRVIMEGIARVDFPPSVVTAQEQRIGVAKIAMALKIPCRSCGATFWK
jgi:hypothetical protein